VDCQLFFTQRALNDLAEIIGRIAEDDAEVATRFGNSLLDHLDLRRHSQTFSRTQTGA
jgi:plasmid stabilization system protein ParE